MAAAEGIVVEAVEDLYQQIQSLSSEALEPVIQKSEDGVRATLGNDVPFIFNALRIECWVSILCRPIENLVEAHDITRDLTEALTFRDAPRVIRNGPEEPDEH